jgi:hypothetical protein
MASIYKGYIDSFVPTATGIIAIVSVDCQQAILSYWKKQSCLLLIDKIEPNPYYFFCKYYHLKSLRH